MDPKAHPCVLLETVALGAHQSPQSSLALGTSKSQAILTAISSKSYWHLSKTFATQTGMTNDWLTSQGLISVRALWMRVHGYT